MRSSLERQMEIIRFDGFQQYQILIGCCGDHKFGLSQLNCVCNSLSCHGKQEKMWLISQLMVGCPL